MPKKNVKSKNPQKYNVCKEAIRHPSTWLIIILSVALLAICGISAYGFHRFNISNNTNIETAKLEVFDHIAESYIRDMDFTVNYGQPAIKQITGYGISDEDGVFYITFIFAPQPEEGTTISSIDDLSFRHGIIYFWEDAERGTYSHAFSYHDDDYHPGGEYHSLINNQ